MLLCFRELVGTLVEVDGPKFEKQNLEGSCPRRLEAD